MSQGHSTLFDFAPRELSHSAFWAWVLQTVGGNSVELRDVRELAVSVLEYVGATIPSTIKVDTEYLLPDGAGRIDIFAELDGESALLIENKVSARPSLAQLRAYRNSADYKEIYHLLISTTYPTQEARHVRKDGNWPYLGAEDALELLATVDPSHPIVTDYYSWLARIVERRRRLESDALSGKTESRTEALRKLPGQWAFMEEVTRTFRDQGRQYGKHAESGGNPWTELRFVEQDGSRDALFYRVENLAVGPVFRVHQYQSTPTRDWDAKEQRLNQLRRLWFSSVEETGELEWKDGSNRGRQRCEISRVDLREYGSAELREELSRIHPIFYKRVKDAGMA